MVLEQWLNLAQTLAVIVASGTAIYGINSWRREYREKKKMELAEDVLSLFYEAKDLLSAIRHPFAYAEEGKSRVYSPNETPEQKQALDQAYVVWERYLKYQEPFNKLRALRYRTMVIFGKEARRPFDELNSIIFELKSAASMLGNYWYRLNRKYIHMTESELKNLTDNIDKYSAIFYEITTPDPINEKTSRIISDIEKICKKPDK